MVSRFTSLLQPASLLCVRAVFLLSMLFFSTCSLLGDHEYGLGLATHDRSHFLLASQLFPEIRSYRSAPAYAAITFGDATAIPLIEEALRHDPYAPDLWYGMARMQLKSGNEAGYNAALTQLKRLTPGLDYRIIAEHTGG